MTYKVLITDYVWPTLQPEMDVLGPVNAEVIPAPDGSEETLVGLARDCDAIMTCFAKVTPKVIEAAPKLKIVARYGIGVDNISVETATARGIPVTNVPAYCIDEVSDHALALLLAGARKLPQYDRAVRSGVWDNTGGRPLRRIKGQKLGIIGFGRIGQLVAAKARAFGLDILIYDAYMPSETASKLGVRPVTLNELFSESDFITLHCPLTPETNQLIRSETLGLMKPNAFLINTSRGGLVNLDDLYRALKKGSIGGAGLDVLPQEPPDFTHPVFTLDNVVFTPHAAFFSDESLVDLETLAAEEVARVLSGRDPVNVVNRAQLAR